MPQASPFVNTSVIVYDWSHTEFASSSDCPSGLWSACFILTVQEGSDDDAKSGTYIDTLNINSTDYVNITTTISWRFAYNVSGSHFQFIVYNVNNGTRGIAIFEELVANQSEFSTMAMVTSQFHLGQQVHLATQLQLRFRTWCDSDDCTPVQSLYLDDIIVTGNATTIPTIPAPSTNPTMAPSSTVLLNSTAPSNSDFKGWLRSNNITVHGVSDSYCYMASDPCVRLFANNSFVSWLKTPLINVENYVDISLEFNMRSAADVTSGSLFMVEIDHPSTSTIAAYNKTELVCHSSQLVLCYLVTCLHFEFK